MKHLQCTQPQCTQPVGIHNNQVQYDLQYMYSTITKYI